VLACTHYPLLLDAFVRLAPWPLHWIDPAAAIARRADQVVSERFPLPETTPIPAAPKLAFRFTSAAEPGHWLTSLVCNPGQRWAETTGPAHWLASEEDDRFKPAPIS
jgi:glutamate racemase